LTEREVTAVKSHKNLFRLLLIAVLVLILPLSSASYAALSADEQKALDGWFSKEDRDTLRAIGATSLNDEQMYQQLNVGSQNDGTNTENPIQKQWQNALNNNLKTNLQSVIDGDLISTLFNDIKSALSSSSVANTVNDYSMKLFMLFAVLELILAIYDYLSSGEYAFNSLFALIIRQFLVLGFFYWLTKNAGSFLGGIVSWLETGGKTAGGVSQSNLTFSEIANRGVGLAGELLNTALKVKDDYYVTVLICLIPAFVIMFAFTLMTFTYISVVIQGFFAVTLASLVIGVGGVRWTRDIATNAIRTVAGVGMKIFTVLLIIGMALKFTESWTGTMKSLAAAPDQEQIFQFALKLTGVIFILAGMIRELPGFAAGFISGNAASGGSASTFSATMMSMMSTARMAMNTARTTTNVTTTAARPVGAVLGGNFGAHPINTVKESFVRSEFAQQGGAWGALSRHSSQQQNTQPRDGIGNGPPPQDKT